MDEICIRPATRDDAEAIAAVHIASWRETYSGLIPQFVLDRLSLPERSARWRELLADKSVRHVILAETGEGVCVGFASGGPTRDAQLAVTAEVYALYLLRTFQRRGLGTELFGQLCSRLADAGTSSLGAWVLRDNVQARRFYESVGGVQTCERMEQRGDHALDEVGYTWAAVPQLKAEVPRPRRASP